MPASNAVTMGHDMHLSSNNVRPQMALLQLQGSNAVRAVNDKFTATMTNEVRWRDASTATAHDDGAQSDVPQGSSGAILADSSADSPASDSSTERPLRQITSLTEIQVMLQFNNSPWQYKFNSTNPYWTTPRVPAESTESC
jgi:hypothetical protein